MSVTKTLIQIFMSIFIAIAVIGLVFWLYSSNELRSLQMQDAYVKKYAEKAGVKKTELIKRVGLDNERADSNVKDIAVKIDANPMFYFVDASEPPKIVEVKPTADGADALAKITYQDWELDENGNRTEVTKIHAVAQDGNSKYAIVPPTESVTEYLKRLGLEKTGSSEWELKEWMLGDIIDYQNDMGGIRSLKRKIESVANQLRDNKVQRDAKRKDIMKPWGAWDQNSKTVDEEITKKEQQLISDYLKNAVDKRDRQREFERKYREYRELVQQHVLVRDEDRVKDEEILRDIDSIRRKIFDLLESELASSDKMVADGRVIAVSLNPTVSYCWINIGRENGVRDGMRFTVFRDENGFQKKTGEVEVSAVHATGSECKIIVAEKEVRRDPFSGWETTNSTYLFSPFVHAGAEGKSELVVFLETGNQNTERQQIIDSLRPKKPAAEEASLQKSTETSPIYVGTGVQLIQVNDCVANPLFIPILPEREYRVKMKDTVKELKDIPLGRLSFYIAQTFPETDRNYIQQMVTYDDCGISTEVNPDTDYFIAPPYVAGIPGSADRLDFIVRTLTSEVEATKAKVQEEAEDSEAVQELRRRQSTLEMAKMAKQLNVTVLTVDESQDFFRKRRSKAEQVKGKMEQPGRQRFYIAGDTILHSRPDLIHYIEDNGGLIAYELNTDCDYVIAGNNSEKDIEVGKKLGIRVIRETELPQFFGLK